MEDRPEEPLGVFRVKGAQSVDEIDRPRAAQGWVLRKDRR
jgi:hypothetical protein